MNENDIKVILDKHHVEDSENLANALSEILPKFIKASINTIDEEIGKKSAMNNLF
ncbi:hypothetical protein LLCRE1631_00008 [Lactococcus lactis subsp. lactis CNCM I-1631]|nr:hypothetical protein LLCRE1631_00008 [Lactococcus lactis subsp. lactis CNCM I-1631]